MFLLIKALSKNNYELFKLNLSTIKFKIKGTGNIKIYYNYKPDEIYINGNKQYVIQNSYYFKEFDNFIELIWYSELNSCDYMFYGCSNIYEMDLSNFNTSIVENMASMFQGCYSLISINLSNFDTSQVTHIGMMFMDCWNLLSLNLSSWNTSKV